MTEEVEDVNGEEVEATDSSPENTTPEDSEVEADIGSTYQTEEEESTEDEEEDEKIPRHRLNEVIQERNEEREKREKLEKQTEFFQNFIANQAPRPDQVPNELDYSKYMNDEGELDLNSYTRDLTERIKQDINNELAFSRKTDTEWQEATRDYPELNTNPQIGKMVKALQTQALVDGKYLTYKQIAQEVFSELGRYKQQGAESAKTSEKIQSGANLVNMGAETPKSTRTLTNADVARMSAEEYDKAEKSGEVAKAIKSGSLKGFSIR